MEISSDLLDNYWITDGGIETSLIYRQGVALEDFAAFHLLTTSTGQGALRDYYLPYLKLAESKNLPIVLETPTWRASPDWILRRGLVEADVRRLNMFAVRFIRKLATTHLSTGKARVSGCMGPRGDGYRVQSRMTKEEATRYHMPQVNAFAEAGVDQITALTMTYVDEAIGIALACDAVEVPTIVSFTIERDGKLPDGTTLADAIASVDECNANALGGFMINCAHPDHLPPTLLEGGEWTRKIVGIRANASRQSHAELDAALTLDDGDPKELAQQYRALRAKLQNLRVFGGCCGTDERHVEEFARILK